MTRMNLVRRLSRRQRKALSLRKCSSSTTFGSFFFPDPEARAQFLQHHAELLEADWWQGMQALIEAGGQSDVFPYPDKRRFGVRFAEGCPRPG